jgi:hypothetical protein
MTRASSSSDLPGCSFSRLRSSSSSPALVSWRGKHGASRQWGFLVLHLIPILMLIAAIVGRMGRTVIALTVVLFLLVFVQLLFTDAELDPRWLRSLHVLNALFIFTFGHHLAQRSRKLLGSAA